MKPALLLAALAVAGHPRSQASRAAPEPPPRYRLAEIGCLPDCEVTVAGGLNNRGEVVGYCYRSVLGVRGDWSGHAFLWHNGKMTALGTLGGEFSCAYGINDQGDIVGSAETPRPTMLPVIWRAENLGTPAALSAKNGVAFAINARGEIAGVDEGVVLWRGPNRIAWGKTPNKRAVYIGDINLAGEVVGSTAALGIESLPLDQHAQVWHDRKTEELATLGGGGGACNGINDAGLIVGWSEIQTRQRHACAWNEAKPTDLGTLGGNRSEANGLNSDGTIVGSAEDAGKRSSACIWRDGKAVDLNTLLEPATGWELYSAKRINDRGQILASGSRPGRKPAGGFVLLTPVGRG